MLQTQQVIGPKRGEEDLGLGEGERGDSVLLPASLTHRDGPASETLESGLGECGEGRARRGRR